MEEPQSQLELYVGECRDNRIIGKIRDFLFSQASGINPSVIERRIQELFASFETPTHPPYALMILKAVKLLNEQNGSTEEAISGFIKNEFQDLPWAHSKILDLHLGKLCKAGELLRTARGRYMLMDYCNRLDETRETRWRGGRRRKKYKRGRNHRGRDTRGRSEDAERCNKLHERENEEQNHLSELRGGTGTYEPIEEQGNSDISQPGMTEVGRGKLVQGQGDAKMRQNENTHERIQEAIIELKNKISSSEIMNTEPHIVGKKNSMVIKLRIPCKKQPDNLRRDETLERTKSAERCDEVHERENEEQNRLSELHGTGDNEMIEQQGKSDIGQRWVTEVCRGRMVEGQDEAETQQNENTKEREKQIEATTTISRFCLDEIINDEKLSASLGSPTLAEKQCDNLPDNLLAVVEYQSLAQQIEATAEMSRLRSDEISNDENLTYSLGSPTVSVIPKEKLQISEQEEQHQNETPSVQQKFSASRELLLDQEGPEFCMETTCSSLSTVLDLPVPISTENCPTFDSQDCLTVSNSAEFLEHTPLEGIELTQPQLLDQTLKCGSLEADLYAAFETLGSMTFHEHKQPQDDISESPKGRVEENTTFGDLEKHMPMPQCIEWQPIEKSFADYQEVPLMASDGSVVDKQKPKIYKMKKQLQLRPQGRGIGRGRRRSLKLDRNPHKHKEKLQLLDQTLTSVNFPSLEPNETAYSLPAPNLPPAPNLEQLVDPTSEESPSCITRGISQLQLYLQRSWDALLCRDLGANSKLEDSVSSRNCRAHKPQQHGNKRGPSRKLNLDGKTEFGHLEQQSPKRRRRGRPPHPVPTQDHQWSWVAVEHRELLSSVSTERHCES